MRSMFTSHPRPRRNRVEQVVILLVVTCLTLLATSAGAAARTVQPKAATSSVAPHDASAASLNTAAKRARKADHRLVADARSLKACLRAHPAHCKDARRALQRAGTRLTIAERTLAKVARATGSAGSRASSALRWYTRQAPQITVSSQTLSWTRVANVNSYVFVRKVPGQAEQYSVVSGTSIAPPPVPGATVQYSVRTDVEDSAWAHEVSITYPATTEAPTVEVPDPQAAPTISVSGQTLSWNEVANVSTYVLVTKAPGQAEQYSVVSGTSVAPPAVPGATVHYSVRTDVEGSAWALEVPIAYPASVETPTKTTKAPTTKTPETPTTKTSEAPGTKTPETPTTTTGEGPSESQSPTGSSETFGLPFIKGINAGLQGWKANNTPAIASEMNSLGVNWDREDLPWSEIEPEKGVFKWTGFDETVAAAKANGITILPVVGYAPSWTSPDNAAAYAEFVAAAVARYGPGTSANLQWWELWNEPYFAYAWSEHTPEPEAYGRDALAAAEAAKKVAPSVKLLLAADYQESAQTGGSSPEQKTWINDMFTAAPTLGKWIDGVSVHPYGGDPALPLKEKGGYLDTSGLWGFQRIDTIREKFLAHGVNVPFFITEEGWSTWEFSEATQAHYYADLIQQVKLRPWVRALFPFGLREGTAHPTNNQAGFALLKYGTWEPKAAWAVLQTGFKELS
jgi:hypothetical protein